MLNRVKDVVRYYIPFNDGDDISILESTSRLQDVAIAAILKIYDLDLLEYLEENKGVVGESERLKFIVKAIRRYNIDIYKEAKDPVAADKFVAFYGNPSKDRF
ncbi:MAG: hypothetical protein RRZ64_08360 [Rikenellaceae bacterium]